jgi:ADP-heptose:LPS heptosyltransferase
MKILVIALAGIGDTLLATPLIAELRAQFPDAVLDAFVLWPGSKDILEGNPHLNTVHQCNLITESRLRALRFLWRLRRQRYDISINAHPQSRRVYRLVARIIGARQRLSHAYDNACWLDRLLVNRVIPQDYSIHGVENNLRLVELLGRRPILPQADCQVYLSPADEQWAESFLRQHELLDRPRLGIHIGSGGTKNLRLKRWPFDCYLQLIRRLTHELPNTAILLLGGPEEQVEHTQILRLTPGRSVFVPQTGTLREAAALIKRCHVFLSVDTALMHLAAAVKVPHQIVIEAPTLNTTNLPWRQPFTLVPNPAVHGRNLEFYRYDGRGIRGTAEELTRCMASVTVDQVFAVLKDALTTVEASSPSAGKPLDAGNHQA